MDVQALLRLALDAVERHPQHDLNLGYREALGRACGPHRSSGLPESAAAHRRRARLSILTVRHVLPLWEDHFPEDGRAHLALEMAEGVLRGTHGGDAGAFLAEFQYAFASWYVSLAAEEREETAFDRWRHLVLAGVVGGEDAIVEAGDLFPKLVESLKRQFDVMDDAWFGTDSAFIGRQAGYLAEDMVDSGVPELVEKGESFAAYLEKRRRRRYVSRWLRGALAAAGGGADQDAGLGPLKELPLIFLYDPEGEGFIELRGQDDGVA